MRKKSIRLWSVLISVFVILAVMPAVVFAGSSDPIRFTTQPQNVTAQAGEEKTMSVVASNATSYQWQRSSDNTNWSNIGTTNVNYKNVKTSTMTIKVNKNTAGFVYRCVAKNSAGSANSASAKVILDQQITITIQPKNLTGFAGDEKTMSVRATNVASYQWQRSSDEGETWVNIGKTNANYSGTNSADLIINVNKNTAAFVYRCVVSNSTNTATTEVATLFLKQLVEITAQPQNVSGKAGDVKTLSIKASYATSYQWQRSSDDGETWSDIGVANTNYTGVKEASMKITINKTTAGFVYRCVAKNGTGPVNSEAAVVTLIQPVSIKSQPKSVSGLAGAEKTMSVSADNATAYQWQRSSDDGQTWADIGVSNANYSNVKTNTLTIVINKNTAGFVYRCVAKNTCGPVESEAASVTLIPPVTITTQPKNVSGKAGDLKTFTVKANNATSYQWQRSADGVNWSNIATTNVNYSNSKTESMTVKINVTTAGFQYRCVVKNSADSAESSAASVTLILPPEITSNPESVEGMSGDEMTMTVEAVNATAYQWQRSADGETWTDISVNNGNYSGVKTNTLTIVINKNTAGMEYRCVAKNYAGSTASEAAEAVLDAAHAYVTFYGNGGYIVVDGDNYQTYTIQADTGVVLTNVPGTSNNNTNLTMVGWYLDADCTDAKYVDLKTYIITGDVKLYAKWSSAGIELPFVPMQPKETT